MSSSSWKKVDFLIQGQFLLQKSLFYIKEYGGRGQGAVDREFGYTSSKFYSDIAYYFWLSIFSNIRATS